MTAKIFIDGEVGTTGLQIRERLEGRKDLEFLSLGETERKDLQRRREMLNAADVVILCLPDDAARDAVAMIENDTTRVIDASTAHRTAEGWVYGFPELDRDQVKRISEAKRITNPGCYAISSVSILRPLVSTGLVPVDFPVSINAVSGYSGGGKPLIAAFEDENVTDYTDEAFRVYGLNLQHKHVPEITGWSGLEKPPLFVPSVGRFRQGMLVQVPLQLWAMPGKPQPVDVYRVLADHYAGRRFVTVPPMAELSDLKGLDPESLNGSNELRLHVFGNAGTDQAVVMAMLDNLGKGASGQAVQNLNIMLGVDEGAGL